MRSFSSLMILWLLAAAPSLSAAAGGYAPGLGEIMALTANRHTKLWLAGNAGNWELAEYELDELEEGFEDVEKYHPKHKSIPIPLPKLIAGTMKVPLENLRAAVKTRNKDAFVGHYDQLTDGCNNCHLSTKFGFNTVIRPSHNPFPSQRFEPNS